MKIITPQNDGYHYFFGYYDLQPFDSTGKYHLCNRVKFMDRLPKSEDVCELGMIDLETNEFIKLSETTAWNFQQGSLLRWFRDDDHIVYNVFDGEAFRTEVKNIKTGETPSYPMAVAATSQDGQRAVRINFSRIYDFRPGYGYPHIPDPFYNENAPKDDGVYLMDMDSGECKMIIDYEQIKRDLPQKPYCDGKLLVNHITFNPAGDRFLFLLRNFPEPGKKWNTMLVTSDLEGNLFALTEYCINSHYHWKNDREVLIVTSVKTEATEYALYLLEDITGKVTRLPEPNPTDDIHCIYSPDRRYIAGDAYPSKENIRTIWLIDTETNKIYRAVDSYSVPTDNTDLRCDLHIRWSPDGKTATYDSTHTGDRIVCMVTLDEMLQGECGDVWYAEPCA